MTIVKSANVLLDTFARKYVVGVVFGGLLSRSATIPPRQLFIETWLLTFTNVCRRMLSLSSLLYICIRQLTYGRMLTYVDVLLFIMGQSDDQYVSIRLHTTYADVCVG